MRNGHIVMTGLPPTRGHELLIDFAEKFVSTVGFGTLTVLLCSRDGEPISGEVRVEALRRHYEGHERIRIVHRHENDPQNPQDHPRFYAYWHDVITKTTGCKPGDMLFASDAYGVDLAKALECQFVPCDVYREISKVSATAVRMDLIKNFNLVLPEFQRMLRRTITVFGAESTGKTTISKAIADAVNGQFVPEWARQYLMVTGAPVNAVSMEAIIHGQFAVQDVTQRAEGHPFVIRDTDLLSTIGYYRICGLPMPDYLPVMFETSKADLYIVMNSGIPFEPDPLRYGGDRRESSDEFWISLLQEFGCKFVVMPHTDRDTQLLWAVNEVNAEMTRHPVSQFVRRTYSGASI